jgi:phage portal protein BeeE
VTSLLDRLRGRPSSPPRAAKAVTDISPWQGKVPLSLYSQEPQEKARAYLGAYKVGWFYKAGSKIARDVSTLDWSVSDGDAEEGEEETTLDRPDLRIPFRSLGPIDQFMRLLERPNPSYTGRQLFHKTQVRIDFAGAAAWYLENGSQGLPTAIYGISPARMWPSYDKAGKLIGWVMDKDKPEGGVPFAKEEILWFTTGNATDDEIWGQSVVEAVYAQVPLSEQAARHTSNVLTTGGRLAGMLWPKDRALSENEFIDAQRAWRNVASDPNAAKRLLIFPEPMEYASGASTPAEIGIPELAELNQTEILTAFPVSPYMLGVPQPAGMNASGETRREERRDYWEGTIHPRADLLEEFIQVGLLNRYEEAEGRTLDFEIVEPDLDDAERLISKAAAFKELVAIGLDPKESLQAVELAHIKFLGLPALIDPVAQAQAQQQAQEAQVEALRQRNEPAPAKATKSRDDIARKGTGPLVDFFEGQRERVEARLRESLPPDKKARAEALKSPDWWDGAVEDKELKAALRHLYLDVSRTGLQVVADRLDRIVPNKAVARIVDDLFRNAGERIRDINDRTLDALTLELAEGARRGYSINQLVDGVPDEGFKGVRGVTLDNGTPVFSDYRAEMVARTETMLSYNRASLDGYKEFGVSQVLAYDGDDDEECAARDGQVFSLDDAFAIDDHPNGTLDWAPVVP